jgi:hypothetical protein
MAILPLPFLLLFSLSFRLTPLLTLSFVPFNGETTATIEDDFLTFDTKGQSLTLTGFPSAALVEVRMHVSGFLINEEAIDKTSPVFTLTMGQQIKTVDRVEDMGWITTTFFLAKATEITIIFTNFATLEVSSFGYQVMMDEVIVLKRGL